jgi:hypothetical protein
LQRTYKLQAATRKEKQEQYIFSLYLFKILQSKGKKNPDEVSGFSML